MKRIINSMVIAFSMYSKLPMPRVEWEKENMQYAMCFFPLVGAVIAVLLTGWKVLAAVLGFGMLLESAGFAVIPILVTGGIHLDGFLDTIDALSSYQSKERKLEILKDPHTGAFAIIYCLAYGIVLVGFSSELCTMSIANPAWAVLMGGFLFSRSLSGISVVTLRSAKTSGLLAMFQSAAKKRLVTGIMAGWIVVIIAGMTVFSLKVTVAVILVAAAIFLIYRKVAYKQFGGVTGDLAGFFLVLCELGMLAVVVIVAKWC